MLLPQIQKRARSLGVQDTWKYSKKELIQEIQRKEGNSPCFGSLQAQNCPQNSCLWRSDCVE